MSHPITHLDLDAFAAELAELRAELKAEECPEDVDHMRKIEGWGRLCTAFGLATAWIIPNPISALALSTGIFARWAMVAHHVSHRGYDRHEESPPRYRSKTFAQGWRRYIDWLDWMHPAAWHHEHDFQHHYKLGEEGDPDVPESNAWWLRDSRIPMPLRTLIVYLGAMIWKPIYYAPNTLRCLMNHEERKTGPGDLALYDWRLWNPAGKRLWRVFFQCWLPYGLVRFALLPALFLFIAPWAALNVLLNMLLAEIFTNLHSFFIIVPNHAGDDLWRFDEPIEQREEFFVRQIVGSSNYRTGGDLNDFLHGFLNYQIEHHVWPDLSMRSYQRAQPRLKALCEKHGVPYVQESVLRRAGKTVDVLTGRSTMKRWPPALETA